MERVEKSERSDALVNLTAGAWLLAFFLGLVLPGVLFFYAVLAAWAASSVPSHASSTALLAARCCASGASALGIALIVIARRRGFAVLTVALPAVASTAAALFLWIIQAG